MAGRKASHLRIEGNPHLVGTSRRNIQAFQVLNDCHQYVWSMGDCLFALFQFYDRQISITRRPTNPAHFSWSHGHPSKCLSVSASPSIDVESDDNRSSRKAATKPD